MIVHSFEQRSPEWYAIRVGKITSTKIKSVLGELKSKTGLNNQKTKGAIENLAMELAIESKFGMIEDSYISYDMQRGIDHEDSAYNELESMLKDDDIECSQLGFIEYNEHIGTSPDGICTNNSIIEIKCPNLVNFFKLKMKDEIDEAHINQCQHHMMCSGTDRVYYFNYLQHNNEVYSYLQEIMRDEAKIKLILDRCEMIIDLKLKYIDKL